MPEGHTLHRLAAALTSTFAGRRVRVGSPQGRFAADAAVLDGTTLVAAESAGKHLFVEFAQERFVHVHLGLIGRFDIVDRAGDLPDEGGEPPEVPEPVGAVRLRVVAADDLGLAYADLRGAIECRLITLAERDTVIARLGPDPLRPDADPDKAWRRIGVSKRPVGDLLMDQTVLAGIGNVYRAEVLFRHRLHPLRPGRSLRRSQWHAVWDDLVVLMAQGVATGRIDTVRPEHTPEAMGRPPRVDDHGGEVYVYRRTGQPCLVCGRTVRTDVLAGRNIFWCPRCQPVFRSRAAA